MKKFVFILTLTWSLTSFCQGYAPFNTDSPKRFMNSTNLSDNDYYFFSRQTSINGDTTVFNQYLRQSTATIDVADLYCQGWGSGYEYLTADTTWLGRQFSFNSLTQELKHKNTSSEELLFDLGLNLGDSSVFYSGINSEYFIRYDVLNYELVIDSMDWVKTFTIWKYDELDNLLPSSLNGFELKLSENYGLVNFIDCHTFPTIEKGLSMMGQLNPSIGYYQLTYDEVYPWMPGDTIETKGINQNPNFPQTISHQLITIQNRVETSDSVWIYLNIEYQVHYTSDSAPWYLAPYNIFYPNTVIYKKGTAINAYPNNTVHENTTYIHDSIVDCGTRGRYKLYENFYFYCDSSDCFSPYDGYGTSAYTKELQTGLGIVYISQRPYGEWNYYPFAEVIYSNIGGVQCGSYAPLTVDEIKLNQNRYLVKVVDLLGRETAIKPNSVQIYIYSDGTTEKMFSVE